MTQEALLAMVKENNIRMANYNSRKAKEQIKKEEKTMITPEKEKNNALINWALDAFRTQKEKLYTQFGLDPVKPKNDEEMIAWIKAERFKLEDRTELWSGETHKKLIWLNPDNPPNKAGYDEASKKLDRDYTSLYRIIMIKTPDDGLNALIEFEGKTYS